MPYLQMILVGVSVNSLALAFYLHTKGVCNGQIPLPTFTFAPRDSTRNITRWD